MPIKVTKAAGNRYCQARMKASEGNEKFLTRAGAAEELPGVTEESLKKYELDINRPPNTVVCLMADAYGEPELRTWYCANECPIGEGRILEIEDMPPERAAIRMLRQMSATQDSLNEFITMIQDGTITLAEMRRIPTIKRQFQEARQKADEMLAAIEKIEKEME